MTQSMTGGVTAPLCLCGRSTFSVEFEYRSRPEGEVGFRSIPADKYFREVIRCQHCGHFLSLTNFDLDALYQEDYITSTYGSLEGLNRRFEIVINLPADRSDNKARVGYVDGFFRAHSNTHSSPSLLDIGAGLGVFAHEMARRGYRVSGIEPDPRSREHLERRVGIRVFEGDFLKMKLPSEVFDLVTLNKVLEHVKDPIAMLSRSGKLLASSGRIYIELPDGEMACTHGSNREEFFIDHFHVFSLKSAEILIQKAGFRLLEMTRLREPSGKFTIRAFLGKETA